MIDVGRGSPVLLIPGIQGRWEWMRPAVDALSVTCRVLSFSLGDVPPEGACFDRWQERIDAILDRAGLGAVTLVGVSFGGLFAARYAAARPERVAALVLVSTPAPQQPLGPRQVSYLRRPILSMPAFASRAAARLLPEVIACRPTWPSRLAFLVTHLSRVIRYPASPRAMARWAHAWQSERGTRNLERITAPTLLLTGEPHLDHVVPVSSTLEFLTLIPGSRHAVLPNTGHVGLVLTPQAFARIVGEFCRSHDADAPRPRRIARSPAG